MFIFKAFYYGSVRDSDKICKGSDILINEIHLDVSGALGILFESNISFA